MSEESADHDETERTTTRRNALAVGSAAVASVVGIGGAAVAGRAQDGGSATVRIENVSTPSTLSTSGGSVPVPLSPGAYAVHTPDEPIWTNGEPERDNGLEEIAEDGKPMKLARSLNARRSVQEAGAFAVPVGADGPGPLLPGNAYEFTISPEQNLLGAGRRLSFVTMFIQSNDLFYAVGGADGMALFEGRSLVTGDVTDRVGLYDAGTEINQEPGVGEFQAPRQAELNQGDVERGTVAPIEQVNGYDYPPAEDVIRVTITEN
ncbi:MAG: spondin domain-containing protein [Halobaculum sp.]